MDRPERSGNGAPMLGILTLENVPLRLPGAMGDPATFPYPTRYRTVPGAWVEQVLRGDPEIGDAYAAAARALVEDGATALTTNCGFSVLYQARLAAEVGVPIATSSLLLLPWMARLLPEGGLIGVATYDARSLTARHLEAAGLAGAGAPVVIAGIDGSASWAELARPSPRLEVRDLERDVLTAVRGLLADHPRISLVLLECAAFCPVTARVREEAKRPVLDFVTLANLVMASVAGAGPGVP
jgi:Asp/Glu/hydantoin racemase